MIVFSLLFAALAFIVAVAGSLFYLGLIKNYLRDTMRSILQSGEMGQLLKLSLTQAESTGQMKKVVQDHIHDFLENRLREAMPGLAMFIDEPLIEEFKKVMDKELDSSLDDMMRNFGEDISHHQRLLEKIMLITESRWLELSRTYWLKKATWYVLGSSILAFLLGMIIFPFLPPFH